MKVSISKAAQELSVHQETLRRWEASEKITSERTLRGHRCLGERFVDKSLIIPTLYKTVIFTFLVLVFRILAHFVFGFLKGIKLDVVWDEFIQQSSNEM